MKTIKGYKFIQKDMRSKNGHEKWKLSEWKKTEDTIEMCTSGFHACMTPLQSLEYIYGDRWFVVEAKGEFLEEKDDKFVASEMRLVEEIPMLYNDAHNYRFSTYFSDKEFETKPEKEKHSLDEFLGYNFERLMK